MTWINHKWVFFSLLSFAFLTACESEKPTYSYLMQHPGYLQRSYHRCIEEGRVSTAPCDTITRAQSDFADLINQREQDPEHFGARVLQEEENKAYLKKQLAKAEEVFPRTKESLSEFEKRKQALQASELQVNILLAVIAATSNV